MSKRIISVILSVILCSFIGLSVQAESATYLDNSRAINNSDTIQPYYNYASSVNVTLSNSSGNAKCTTIVNGYVDTATKIKITMTLQKKTLFWWSEVNSWTTTVSDESAYFTKTASVNSGTYRIKAECIVYSGSNSETITQYSSEREF